MRVCFVLPSLRASGGVGVATQHARLMREHGVEAELVVLGAGAGGVDPARPRARRSPRRAKATTTWRIGTWWETVAPALSLPRRAHAMLLQSFEQRFYGRDAPFERLSAEATLSLPLDFVAVGDVDPRQLSQICGPGRAAGSCCRASTSGSSRAARSSATARSGC